MNNILNVTMNAAMDYLLLATVFAALLVGISWCIIRLGRIKTAIHLHMVWLFTLIAIVIMPVMWLYGPKLPISLLPVENPFGEILLQQIDFNSGMSDEGFSLISLFSGKNIFLWLWCAGFVFLSTRLLVGGYRLSRIIDSSIPVSVDKLPAKVVMKRVRLLRTSHLNSPVCLGLVHPIILLPERIYHNSNPEELRMILRHEIAHIARRDCWVNLFQRVVEALLFFHPLVWYASHQITDQREQLCDNHVIRDGVPPANYVKMLTRIAEQYLETKRYHAVALFEGKLLTRIGSLLEPGNKNQTKASLQATVTGLTVMLVCIATGTIQIGATDINDSRRLLPPKENHVKTENLFLTSYKLVDVDDYPAVIQPELPVYPASAKEQSIEGKVLIRLVIDNEGYAREPEVISAEPEGVFEEAAINSIAGYRFKPAVKDGKNVACIARIPIVFKLAE